MLWSLACSTTTIRQITHHHCQRKQMRQVQLKMSMFPRSSKLKINKLLRAHRMLQLACNDSLKALEQTLLSFPLCLEKSRLHQLLAQTPNLQQKKRSQRMHPLPRKPQINYPLGRLQRKVLTLECLPKLQQPMQSAQLSLPSYTLR